MRLLSITVNLEIYLKWQNFIRLVTEADIDKESRAAIGYFDSQRHLHAICSVRNCAIAFRSVAFFLVFAEIFLFN